MIQQTTALRKIASLRKRIKGIQGGQGASKTYSILMLIINHASSVADREIYIASDELSKMRITVIKDFCNIMKMVGIFKKEQFTDGTLYKFPNGSFIKFLGLDKDDIGKGLRSDLVFVNEANKVKFSTYRELTSRSKQVFLDFNPNKKFWFHTEVMTRNDCDFLKLTFLDNEFLSKEEVSEILRYKQRGFDLNGVVVNTYWANMWRVYGLGEVGQVEGRIYNWKSISYFDYLNIEKETYYGCDWGLVDPFAVVEVKYYDGNLYVHELNYASENELRRGLNEAQMHQINAHQDEGLISWLFERLNIRKEALIVCDSNRPTKIHALRRSGWEYAVAVGGKSRVVDRIGTLQSLNIYYTDSSRNIAHEQETYCRKKDKFEIIQEEPEDDNNHTLDAITYITEKLFKMGVIKNL